MLELNSKAFQSCFIAFLISFFSSIFFNSTHLFVLIVIIIAPLFLLLFVKPIKFIFLLVILSIFIEVSFQQISFLGDAEGFLNFNGIINIFIIGCTLSLLVLKKINLSKSSLGRSFLLYLGIVLLSIITSSNWFLTIKSFFRIATGFCIYLLITNNFKREKDIERLYKLLLLITIIPICAGLFQIVIINKFHLSQALRISGTFKNGQSYSMYLGIISTLVFARFLFSKVSLLKKLFGWFYLIFIFINLLFQAQESVGELPFAR